MPPSIRHNPENYQDILVLDRTILRIDLECEKARVKQYLQVVGPHGHKFKNQSNVVLTVAEHARCFDAAYYIARRYNLIYCEGVAWFPSPHGYIAIGHGWCCDERGGVIDPHYAGHPRGREGTLRRSSHQAGLRPDLGRTDGLSWTAGWVPGW